MPDIYEQHRTAFSRVSAFVILRDGERVATVAIKFPSDGAGRLFAYAHLIGAPMVRAYVSGGGYDKRSAAIAEAIEKIALTDRFNSDDPYSVALARNMRSFKAASTEMHGNDWTRCLEKQGFQVLQAV